MSGQHDLTQPPTLEPGKIYLRRMSLNHRDQLLPVEFIDYSPCPAIIVVWNGSTRERCPRDELYEPRVFYKSINHAVAQEKRVSRKDGLVTAKAAATTQIPFTELSSQTLDLSYPGGDFTINTEHSA